ncbi:hypothetical protein FSARC_3453 [Fusarium sarcochroum]|uniref:Uncharacterized protein n=1 Tax=Fusarium sarcochroum TaxID=1208366 RepID=A0A8H4U3W8_9HYPO|nr:hypothetical protein FSARC_3453 [Fusarium sarcochroum]
MPSANAHESSRAAGSLSQQVAALEEENRLLTQKVAALEDRPDQRNAHGDYRELGPFSTFGLNTPNSMGITRDPYEVARAAAALLRAGADSVSFHLEPFGDDELIKIIRRDQAPATRFSGENPPARRVPRVAQGHEQEECLRCGSSNHTMATCIDAPEGEVKGCTICNKEDHPVDECINSGEMSLKRKVEVMVTSRGNMSPLKTKVPWYTLLHEYLMSDEFKAEDLPTAFPWSVQFAEDISWEKRGKHIIGIQKKFDATGDKTVLPVDPTTESVEAIFKNFWEPQNLGWPTRLGDMSV